MPIRIQEMLRLSEASSQLIKLADDVVAGAGKVLTKNHEPFVALNGTRRLAYCRALEAEHPRRVVPTDIAKGFENMLPGRVRSEIEFRKSVRVSNLQDRFRQHHRGIRRFFREQDAGDCTARRRYARLARARCYLAFHENGSAGMARDD